jgi:O-antigen ligase
MLALLLPVSIAGSVHKTGIHKWLSWICIGGMCVALIGTSSRGGMLSLIFGYFLVYVVVFPFKYKIQAILTAALLILLLFGLAPEVFTQTYERTAHAYGIRNDLWKLALEVFFQNPFVGIGSGISRTNIGSSAHNSVLTAFLELGVFGGITFVGLMTTIFLRLRQVCFRLQDSDSTSAIARGILVSFVVAIVHSLTEPLLQAEIFDILFWSIVAIGYSLPMDWETILVDTRQADKRIPKFKVS